MRRTAGLAAAAAAMAIATAGGATAAPAACTPAMLSAQMSVVAGSAGAGNISYALVLRNRGRAACTVSGHPALRLLGAHGAPLPTHVTGVPPGVTAALVTLAPGRRAAAALRFSPDVPGSGE